MIHTGQMVRAGGSAPMKVINISNDIAECIWIDGSGVIRHRFHDVGHLIPMWMSLGPKSLWPETGQLELIEIEKEEHAAAAEKAAKAKASRKARRSKKIKHRIVLA